jgi:hypothetical protein
MPKTKHRRKPGGKAIKHPGRGKDGSPLPPIGQWMEDLEKGQPPLEREMHATPDNLRGLPLFQTGRNQPS